MAGPFGYLGDATEGLTYKPDMRKAVQIARDVSNKMVGPVQSALKTAHAEMAATVQKMAAEELEKRKANREPVQRSKAIRQGPHLLEDAILDPQNASVNAGGFQVGIESWFSRSPAAAYWRRIETGGPNPMHALGYVGGRFWAPGGPTRAGDATDQALFIGGKARAGFIVKAEDRASSGYHMHEVAGKRFSEARIALPAYKRAFKTIGLEFTESYKQSHGRVPDYRSFGT